MKCTFIDSLESNNYCIKSFFYVSVSNLSAHTAQLGTWLTFCALYQISIQPTSLQKVKNHNRFSWFESIIDELLKADEIEEH